MTVKSELGNHGEDLACEYLVEKQCKIVDRNHRKPWGEIDIIARDPDKTLVFVEVKTIRQYGKNNQIKPEDQMTASKLRKLAKNASLYAGANPDLIKQNKGWRVDLIAITLINNEPKISHYKNIIN